MKNIATLLALAEADKQDLVGFIERQAKADMNLLLAHTDTGIVWGQVDFTEGQKPTLRLAADAFADAKSGQQAVIQQVRSRLRIDTLWQLRLFGPGGECFVWRTSTGPYDFQVRLIADGEQADGPNCLNDVQWLWGTLGSRGVIGKGFTLLFEGRQGLVHAPPIVVTGKDDRVALTLRHYIRYSPENCAAISGSRLTGLKIIPAKEAQ